MQLRANLPKLSGSSKVKRTRRVSEYLSGADMKDSGITIIGIGKLVNRQRSY